MRKFCEAENQSNAIHNADAVAAEAGDRISEAIRPEDADAVLVRVRWSDPVTLSMM